MRSDEEILWRGRHLDVACRGRWEYVSRKNVSGVVGVIAITNEGRLLLVEQYRPPVNANVIEIPAGLAGDIAGQEREQLEEAARRELLEETGYEAATMTFLGAGVSTAGLSNETIAIFHAQGLRKLHDGGGDDSEEITVHEVPLDNLLAWLAERESQGVLIDLKIHSGLYLVERISRR